MAVANVIDRADESRDVIPPDEAGRDQSRRSCRRINSPNRFIRRRIEMQSEHAFDTSRSVFSDGPLAQELRPRAQIARPGPQRLRVIPLRSGIERERAIGVAVAGAGAAFVLGA